MGHESRKLSFPSGRGQALPLRAAGGTRVSRGEVPRTEPGTDASRKGLPPYCRCRYPGRWPPSSAGKLTRLSHCAPKAGCGTGNAPPSPDTTCGYTSPRPVTSLLPPPGRPLNPHQISQPYAGTLPKCVPVSPAHCLLWDQDKREESGADTLPRRREYYI